MADIVYPEIPERISFPQEEKKILARWKKIDAFVQSNKLSEGRKVFSFYDGPPFATGLPHYGHILAGTIKDIVTRYAYQTGHHVPRRFGWDCHGLPVEYEIEQKLQIKSKDDVMKLGIPKYNEHCRAIVMRYSSEWRDIIERMGRWIDFDNDYKTLDTEFMESAWWVFKSLYDKGLVYKGFRVMPYSTACTTPLSNFESNLNYKDVNDPAVTVSFPLVDEPDVALLAWTTTPWTLPSNLALCVKKDMTYVKVKELATEKIYILAKPRLTDVFKPSKGKKDPPVEILDSFDGQALVGKKYVPIFPFLEPQYKEVAFRVVEDDYVTSDSGTGVVHQAPAFGEDDYRVCIHHGIINKGEDVPCPVDGSGRFVEPISEFFGMYVKDADKPIIASIKNAGRLLKSESLLHSYPFCWRSETPLIYKAVPSWFIKVEDLKERLIENNKKTRWVPDFVQHNRFGMWLENARDWNVSRSRYWGTPLPIWVNNETGEIKVVGSIKELEELSGVQGITDLHRDNIDHITIPGKDGTVLRRIEEVFDCWFESGSMPYASQHYPFKNADTFDQTFPANFIAEGLDQTRGWFYTLMVLSTALFDKPAFQNCIVNGLVLAEDGKKMSKRLKNYPDPINVAEAHGADALRLYLINSPVVRAEPLKFKESGVKDVIRDVMLPWFNSFRFFLQNAQLYHLKTGGYVSLKEDLPVPDNQMDCWIMSCTESLIKFVNQEMESYRLYTVVPRLVTFIEQLTNWYVRLNRPRLRGQTTNEEWSRSLNCLAEVLLAVTRLMAPFTPFFCEYIYSNMRSLLKEEDKMDSVHFLMMPSVRADLVNEEFEAAVRVMQEVIVLGRIARDRKTLAIKQPLQHVIVVHYDQKILESIKSLETYIKSELNVREVIYSSKEEEYVTLTAIADGKVLGKRLGKAFPAVNEKVKELSHAAIVKFDQEGSIEIDGNVLTKEDIVIKRNVRESFSQNEEYEAVASAAAGGSNNLLVLLNTEKNEDLVQEGIAREVVNRIQKLRKKALLLPKDKIEIFVTSPDEELNKVIEMKAEWIANLTGVDGILPLSEIPEGTPVIIKENVEQINEKDIIICISREMPCGSSVALSKLTNGSVERTQALARYIQMRSPSYIEGKEELTVVLDGVAYALEKDVHFFKNSFRRFSEGAVL